MGVGDCARVRGEFPSGTASTKRLRQGFAYHRFGRGSKYNLGKMEDNVKRQRREVLAALTAAAGSTLLLGSFAGAEQGPAGSGETKETVTGIGGLFFRAHDPKALAQWYQDHLGVLVIPRSANDPVWKQSAGPTAFSPFPEKSGYFGDPTKQWMINFRVRDLDKMAAQLQAAGIEVKVDPTTYPNGRFARIHDPEGNPIELWQPMDAVPAK